MLTQRIYLKEYFPQLGDDCEASVDCYIPMQMEELNRVTILPCMVICPGGGYYMVSEREGEPVAMKFLQEGYCAFVIHYSTAPKGFPTQLLEVAAALEIISINAEKWHCDINDVSLVGFSAGGHLAAQYANRYDCPEVRAVFPDSKPVQRNILGYPVITSTPELTHGITIANFVGHEPETRDEKGCSCELLVTSKTPPTFIWHTAEDAVVPVENSLLYAQALSANNVSFELHIYPYGVHGLSTLDPYISVVSGDKVEHCKQWVDDCIRWLKIC